MTRLAAGLFVCICALSACESTTQISQNHAKIDAPYDHSLMPYVQVQHPNWAKDAVIYQINTRQFTPEGTFAAAQESCHD